MNRVFLSTFLAVVGLLGGFGLAQGHPDAWTIGVRDEAPRAYLGALEFLSVDQATFFAGGVPSLSEQLANGWRYVTFDYTVTGPTDDNPQLPGYIGPQNVCIYNTSLGRPCTVSTSVLQIHFALQCEYREGELDFLISRYGSEFDDVLIDGFVMGDPVDSTGEEGHIDRFRDLPSAMPGGVLGPGPHTITIAYVGGGSDNGHYIDALQLIPNVESCVAEGGRMTGGGSVLAEGRTRITHGFELHCNPAQGPNNLQVNWRGRGWSGSDGFHLETLDSARCIDTGLQQAPPVAGFDTYIGSGTGRYNGGSGYTAEWVFTDAGEPGINDTASILITAPDGTVILDISGNLQKGNQQAH